MNKNQPFNDLPLLPPAVNLETTAILKKTIEANRQLAELKGLVNSMPNQEILVDGIVLQEARLSSEIENIVTTTDELYKAAEDEKLATDPQTKEVLRYRQALWSGFEELKERPLSTNLFIDLVRIIKGRDIGIRRVPGTKIANSKGEVLYTPPEGESVIRDKLSNLEHFIHDDNGIDTLIKLAIMHYQFEAIHPFVDGNGRTGRVINILFLAEKGLLDKPILFLSHYILRTRQEYYKGLQRVTEEGAWADWVMYMLEAVRVTAFQTRERVFKILEAIESAKKQVQDKAPKIYSRDLIDIIFRHPYCKVRFLEDAGLAKRQTAALYLQTLEKLNLLESIKVGTVKYYINKPLIEIFST